MSDNTYNVVELVGTSEESITKAIDVAIAKASQSIRRLGWFQVIQVRGLSRMERPLGTKSR